MFEKAQGWVMSKMFIAVGVFGCHDVVGLWQEAQGLAVLLSKLERLSYRNPRLYWRNINIIGTKICTVEGYYYQTNYGYDSPSQKQYQHIIANNFIHFIDSPTRAHTQSAEFLCGKQNYETSSGVELISICYSSCLSSYGGTDLNKKILSNGLFVALFYYDLQARKLYFIELLAITACMQTSSVVCILFGSYAFFTSDHRIWEIR
jgi:hypothetical protein